MAKRLSPELKKMSREVDEFIAAIERETEMQTLSDYSLLHQQGHTQKPMASCPHCQKIAACRKPWGCRDCGECDNSWEYDGKPVYFCMESDN